MSALDKFHETVKQGLEKDGWTITHDPLRIEFGEEDTLQIDQGAEKVLGAEKSGQKLPSKLKAF